MKPFFPILALLGALGVTARGDDASISPDQEKFFETHIRPALVQYCYDCHSVETGKTRGGLLLDTKEGMLRGGDNGNALAGADYTESLFWESINWLGLEMPPDDLLPDDVIQRFQEWLEMGAPDPRRRESLIVESGVDLEEGRKHWAFQPPVTSPEATIDSHVETQLAAVSLEPVGAADAATLLRRLSFDLVGLPPSFEEMSAFVKAWKLDSQAAIEAKVDELLARPQFGERWGRHWLDVARYAESTGKDVNVAYPYAWRYRDYVIDSFNRDKPYDEFIREQIAGDLLPIKSDEEWQENLIATGFLAVGTKGLNEPNPRIFRMEVVDEQIDTMSQAILGLTVSCARCHDHKTDAISTMDYYALAGIFQSTDTYFGTVRSGQNKRPTQLIQLPIPDPTDAENSYSSAEIARMESDLEGTRDRIRTARQSGNAQAQQMAGLRRRVAELEAKLATIGEGGVKETLAMGVQDAGEIADAHVLVRGDVESPAQLVERGFLQVLPNGGPAQIRTGQSGRRELADWLSSAENPLTARVMVNRIWLHLFGAGLVPSPNNWGVTGQEPTHPELLDHLALEFMNSGWSVKEMIRTIVLTDAYQRSSQMDLANYKMDPDNQWLWRANPRQLDAEALRDAMLTIGGGLDLERPYGSIVAEAGDNRVGRSFSQERFAGSERYRSVYLPILRDDLPEALGLFDFADPSVSMPKREPTNVPSQALYLMNSPWVMNEAVAMAKTLSETYRDQETQIRGAFVMAFGRLPDVYDLQAASEFFRNYEPVTMAASSQRPPLRGPGAGPGGRPDGRGRPGTAPSAGPAIPTMTAEEQTLAIFCQSLMASAEFRLLN